MSFAKRFVRLAARSSAARRVSRLAFFRLLLFATASATASSRVNSGGVDFRSAAAPSVVISGDRDAGLTSR